RGHPVSIMFFTDSEFGEGPADSTTSGHQVLNDEDRNMSAYPDQPGHFTDWLISESKINDGTDVHQMYAPRKLYGEYLQAQSDILLQKDPDIDIRIIEHRACFIKHIDGSFKIEAGSETFTSDYLILATGNNIPSDPKGVPTEFLGSEKYFRNPWTFDPKKIKDQTLPVLIIGTGLTMVDTLLTLRENGFSGKVTAVSPKGFEILPHRKYAVVSEIKDELIEPYRLEELFSLFRKHIRLVRSKGITGEAVVDAVRPFTQTIWKSLDERERKRFLSHLRHLWGLARHRLPPSQHEEMKNQLASGLFEIIGGRIIDVKETDRISTIHVCEKNSGNVILIDAGAVVNCTGPATDLNRTEDTFFRSMIQEGLIQPDALGIGLIADDCFRPLSSSGTPTQGLYALGSLLKGALWESTAVPELRAQCLKVARLISETESDSSVD
ncbi:MAG: FAD/NAD(P)-binding protein, partial [Bacteroidota bacterium]